MVTTMQGALASMFKKVQVSIRRSIGKWHRKNKMSAKGNSGAHMIIEISILENHFSCLRFQRVQQPTQRMGSQAFISR